MKKKHTPWWLSAILAVISYLGIKYFLPQFFPPVWHGFIPQLAPLAAIGFLLYSAALLYEDDIKTTEEEHEAYKAFCNREE
ncbi:hypothetical protein [Desulfotalea psychrophila]|uniref:hypothetical protein n=1 Tax=Desulfotalea psychrophila TaxID=84980 RepID=UPI0002D759B6|nr:hypothetical protein [Desulfotalea psychrophila]